MGKRAREGRGSQLCRAQAAGGPFCCGAALQAQPDSWFLQAHPKQGPATAPSANAGGLCPAPGEFGKARQPPAMLCSLVPSVAMQVGQPTEGCHLDGQGQLLGRGCWTCFRGDTEPLLQPAACRRAGRRLAQADPVARWLSRASKSTPPSHSRGSSCCLPAHPAAPHSTVLQAGQRRAGQALGPLAWGLHWWCLTLFSFAAGGSSSGSSTSRRRMGLPWPFTLRRTPAAAQAPGQAGSSCSRALFGQPLAALCGEDNTLPRPIQVSQPGQTGSPALPPAALESCGDRALDSAPPEPASGPRAFVALRQPRLGQSSGPCHRLVLQPSKWPPASPAGAAGCPAPARTDDRGDIPQSCRRHRTSAAT